MARVAEMSEPYQIDHFTRFVLFDQTNRYLENYLLFYHDSTDDQNRRQKINNKKIDNTN